MNRIRILRSTLTLNFKEQSSKKTVQAGTKGNQEERKLQGRK
jgi:hypothetical protein